MPGNPQVRSRVLYPVGVTSDMLEERRCRPRPSTRPAVADLQAQPQAGLAGQYTLERELGRGGMVTVFLAQDLKHKRSVAFKLLLPEIAATLGSDRFHREIEIAARLQHPISSRSSTRAKHLCDLGSGERVLGPRPRGGRGRRAALSMLPASKGVCPGGPHRADRSAHGVGRQPAPRRSALGTAQRGSEVRPDGGGN